MELPTGQVPESYQIYLDQFDSDPEGTLNKLENHVSKRNSGAVGYYLLAMLSRKAGRSSDALKFALSAKILAPGSEFFRHFPYYIQHPDYFDAWTPKSMPDKPRKEKPTTDSTHPIHNLDHLISKLSNADTKRIRVPKTDKDSGNSAEDLSKQSVDVDDIVTETLALIHEKQGNYEAAIKVYKQLRLTNCSKREYYDEKILRLWQRHESEDAD